MDRLADRSPVVEFGRFKVDRYRREFLVDGAGQCFEGVLRIKRGDSVTGARLLRAALAEIPPFTFHIHAAMLLAELTEGLGGAGQIAEGLAVIDDALARAERTEGRWCIAEQLRTKGELLLLRGTSAAAADAEECFRRALDWAQRQGALWWELGSATSLARLYHRQGRTSLARKVLSPVYRRFTEGFKTPDVAAAKALLESFRWPVQVRNSIRPTAMEVTR
jgi:predicted ATPase